MPLHHRKLSSSSTRSRPLALWPPPTHSWPLEGANVPQLSPASCSPHIGSWWWAQSLEPSLDMCTDKAGRQRTGPLLSFPYQRFVPDVGGASLLQTFTCQAHPPQSGSHVKGSPLTSNLRVLRGTENGPRRAVISLAPGNIEGSPQLWRRSILGRSVQGLGAHNESTQRGLVYITWLHDTQFQVACC